MQEQIRYGSPETKDPYPYLDTVFKLLDYISLIPLKLHGTFFAYSGR